MHKIALIALLLAFSPLFSHLAQAEDAVTENLKRRLQESLQIETSPSPTIELRAYIGTIKDLIGNTLVINGKDGKQDIRIEDGTVILRSPGNTNIKQENINIGDYLIAIGYPGDGETLLGRRLIVSSSPIESPPKLTAMGTVKKMDKTSLTLSIDDNDQKILVNAKTTFKSPAGPIEFTDLELGDTLIYAATLSDSTQTATILMRVKTAPIE
ncbi:MAG: hypothetical protein ACD_40C00251G0003 [uncultured bacterium]|nr:MAG: hypothetical protein ACD_40C00251G0003 [uncultured bacterium]